MIERKKFIIIFSICSVLLTSGVLFTSIDASPSGNTAGNPIIFTGGIVENDSHIYQINVLSQTDELQAGLAITNPDDNLNIIMVLFDPGVGFQACAFTPIEFNMLASSCEIQDPEEGLWDLVLITLTFADPSTIQVNYAVAVNQIDNP